MAKRINRHGSIGLGGTPGVPDTFSWKFSARLAADVDVDISSCPATIDGFAMSGATIGDRLLLPNQTDPIENGLRAFNGIGSALARTADMDGSLDVAGGAIVDILQGDTFADEAFRLTSDFPTPDVDPMNFELDTGSPTIDTVEKNSSFALVTNDNGKAFIIDASGGNVVITCPVLFDGFNATFLREDDGTNDISFLVSSTTLKSVGAATKIANTQNSGASVIYDVTDEFYLKGEVIV